MPSPGDGAMRLINRCQRLTCACTNSAPNMLFLGAAFVGVLVLTQLRFRRAPHVPMRRPGLGEGQGKLLSQPSGRGEKDGGGVQGDPPAVRHLHYDPHGDGIASDGSCVQQQPCPCVANGCGQPSYQRGVAPPWASQSCAAKAGLLHTPWLPSYTCSTKRCPSKIDQ